MSWTTTMTELGFVIDESAAAVAQAAADSAGLSEGGTYRVQQVWRRLDVTVTVEQNQAPETVGGMQALITHPPVAVIDSPAGRYAFNPEDTELARNLLLS